MLDDQTTVADFFLSGDSGVDRMDPLEAAASIADLRAKLAKEFDGLRWSAVWDAVKGQLNALLDIRFVDVLLGAWIKYEELRKYADPDQHSPQETHLVPLVEHEITSSHQPAVEIEIGDTFREKIPFEVTLALKLSGMLLQLRGGRILKVYTGRCLGSGSLKCSGVTLLEKETAEVRLPGMIDLGEGIAIDAG